MRCQEALEKYRPRRTRLCEQRPEWGILYNAKQVGFRLISRLRLDASLFEPAPKRRKGQIGLPALKGKRRPKLNAILVDPKTVPGAAWPLLAGDPLGARIDVPIQHHCAPPPCRLGVTPTDLQRRDRRRPPHVVVATEFFYVSVGLRKHGNPGHVVKSTPGGLSVSQPELRKVELRITPKTNQSGDS